MNRLKNKHIHVNNNIMPAHSVPAESFSAGCHI